MNEKKHFDYYSIDSLTDAMRKQADGMHFIIHQDWKPSRKTLTRLCNELKEKPYMWKKNKLVHRRVRIVTFTQYYRLEIILTYSPANHILCRYVMRIKIDDGGGRIFDHETKFGDRETQTVIEQITRGWE